MLLLRLSGAFLLRLAERTFCGSLFHEPPRNTRRGSASPSLKDCRREQFFPQTFCFSMDGMTDPASHMWVNLVQIQPAFMIKLGHFT
jgi:hypothetical protein